MGLLCLVPNATVPVGTCWQGTIWRQLVHEWVWHHMVPMQSPDAVHCYAAASLFTSALLKTVLIEVLSGLYCFLGPTLAYKTMGRCSVASSSHSRQIQQDNAKNYGSVHACSGTSWYPWLFGANWYQCKGQHNVPKETKAMAKKACYYCP
jgi:hypothetical protein